MAIHITTNNHPRHITYGFELSLDEREQFDYLTDDEMLDRTFVKYRGEWYDLDDVMLAPDNLRALGWDGFNSDSYWSGIAFRYFDRDGDMIDGGDSVVVGSVYVD